MNRTAIIAAAIGCLTACGDSTSEPVPLTEVTTIVVTAPSSSIFRNDTLRLTASVRDQNGAELIGIPVTWSSSNPLVASVDSTGRVVGLTPGQVSVTATAETKSGNVQITVVGPGTDGAVPGSALIGTAGGGVAATLPGGGSLALSIPAGALNSNVEISLEPLVPGLAAQASFQIAPAGLRLTTPATLVVKVSPGARVRATTVLVFEQDGQRVPVPSIADPAAGTVTATLAMLGLPEDSSAAASFRTSVLPGGNGSLLDLTIDDMVDDAVAALGQLKQLGTFPAADAMQLSMDAVVQAGGQSNSRFLQLQAEWRAVVCDAGDFAANALESFGFVSDYRGLARVIGAVLGWGSAEAQMRGTMSQIGLPGCLRPALDARALVLAKLSVFQSGIRADLDGFALSPAPRDSVFLIDRISPLLDLVSALQAAGFDSAVDNLITLVSGQFVRLRFNGFSECRGGQRQEIQGRLLRLEAAGGVFAAVSPFDVADLESDIELCGMVLRWTLLDSTGAVTDQGRLGSGTGPGIATLSGTGMIRGDGRLTVQGPLLALRCPAPASANAEQFEVVAGRSLQSLTRVAVLTPSNQDSYLEVSPLTLSFDDLRTAAGVPQDGAGQVSVVFRRIGGTCSGQFVNLAHSPLGTLTLDLEPDTQPPQPPPPPPPPAPIGDIYIGTRKFQGTSNPFPAALIFSTARDRAIFCISPNGTTPNDDSRQCGALGAPFADDSGFLVYNITFTGNSFQGTREFFPGDTITGTIDGTDLTGRQNFTSGLFNTFSMAKR